MDGKWEGFRSFKPGKFGNPPAHRGIARRFKGKMQSEDARVEKSSCSPAGVSRWQGRYATRDDSICPGLARSLRNH